MQSAIKVLLLASAVCAAFGRPQSEYAVGDPFTDGGGHELHMDIGSHGVVAGRHEPLYADGMVRAVDPLSGFGADDYASPRIPIGKRQAVVIDPALSVLADRSEKVYVVPAVNDPVVLVQPVFPLTSVTGDVVVVDPPLVKK